MSSYLREAAESGISLDKYIISTVSDSEPLLSPRSLGFGADNNVLSGITDDDVRRIRKEMLAADKEDIMSFCGVVDRLIEEGAICVVAYRDALGECGGLTVKEL